MSYGPEVTKVKTILHPSSIYLNYRRRSPQHRPSSHMNTNSISINSLHFKSVHERTFHLPADLRTREAGSLYHPTSSVGHKTLCRKTPTSSRKKKRYTAVTFKMFYSSTSILCCKMAV